MIKFTTIVFILKVSFIFSLSFGLIYFVMWLEDKRKERAARRYYKEYYNRHKRFK